jgi:hypothetical protein
MGNIAQPNLAAGARTLQLDTAGFVAGAEGGAAIGQGLMKAGSAFEALQQKVEEASSLHSQYKATEILAKAQENIKTDTANEPDPDKWADIANQHLNSAGAELQNLKMDPKTRELVDHKAEMNKIDVMGGLAQNAVKTKLQLGTKALDDTAEIAAKTSDLDLFNKTRAIATAGPHPFWTKEKAELMAIGFDKTLKFNQNEAAKEQILGIARTSQDPDKLASEWKTSPPKGLTEEQIAYGINRFQEAGREQTQGLSKEAEDEVAKGNNGLLGNEEAVPAWKESHPGFTDAMAEETKRHIAHLGNAHRQQFVAAHAPEMSSALDSEISSFDRSSPSARDDYYALRNRIHELPETYHAPMDAQLKAVYEGKQPPVDKTLAGTGRQATRSMLEEGKLGIYWTNEPVMNQYTNKPAVDGKGNPVTKRVVDPEKYRAAIWQRAQLDGAYQRWLGQNPKATPDQAAAALNNLIPGSTFAKMMDSFIPVLPKIPTDETYQPKGARRSGPPKAEVVPEPETATAPGGLDERTTKNIQTLHPDAQPHATSAVSLFNQSLPPGYTARIIDGSRTHEEQQSLYEQGRSKPGKVVTNAPAGHSNHESGRAFDIGIFKGGKYIEESPLYAKLGAVGKAAGLEWGGDFKTIRDEPHFQVPKKKG